MQNNTENRVYAGFFVRLAAYLVDLMIVGAGLLVLRIPIWVVSLSNPDNFLVRDLVFKYSLADMLIYVVTVTYFILLTYYTGSTLGKKLFQLRVVGKDGEKPFLLDIIYRETIGRFLSGIILNVGYLMIIVDKEKRGVQDLMADTRVIYYHEEKVFVNTTKYYKNMNEPGTPVSTVKPESTVSTQFTSGASPKTRESVFVQAPNASSQSTAALFQPRETGTEKGTSQTDETKSE